jgi:hypothetical protein
MIWWTLGAALAWDVTDAGEAVPGATKAVIVVTPGVSRQAVFTWVEIFEQEGLDAWTATLPSEGQSLDAAVEGLGEAFATLDEDVVIAAHGYAGVLVLLAGLEPKRLVLAGVPLSEQVTTTIAVHPGEVVSEGLPFPEELTGHLPLEPYSGDLGGAYFRWASDFPEYAAPLTPTLVVGSNIDPIAPPETCRLPSRDWPDRAWHRAGKLGVAEEELEHSELLTHPRTARMVARFLDER